MPETALADLLNVALATRPCVALRGAERISGAQFQASVRAWRASLVARGAGCWALYYRDACHFAAALFGAWAAGCEVIVPGDALPATHAALQGRVKGFLGEFAGATTLANPDLADDGQMLPGLNPDTCRLQVFTSGSSGVPVAIVKHLHQLDAEVATLEAVWGSSLGEAVVRGTVSHQHIYGLLFRVLWPLAAGRVFDVRMLEFPEDIAAAGTGPSFALISSPAQLSRLPENLPWQAARTQLVGVFSSGGPLMADAAERVGRVLGWAPVEVLGSSETGGIAQRVRAHDGERWQPLPGVRIRLDADDMLAVSSPHLPDDAWFVTADRAELQGEGFLLRGRADRIAKIEEKRVSLSAVEAALLAMPWVAEVRVALLDGPRRSLGAIIVPSETGRRLLADLGKRAMNERLRSSLRNSVESAGLPRRWRYLDALPLSAQGKLSEAAVCALFEPEKGPAVPLVVTCRVEAETLLETWWLEPALRWFDGHFPQLPVLPGVVQVDWVISRARRLLGVQGEFRGVEALKFQQVLRPGDSLQVSLQWRADSGRLSFTIAKGERICASGRLLFAEVAA